MCTSQFNVIHCKIMDYVMFSATYFKTVTYIYSISALRDCVQQKAMKQ